MRMSIGFMWLRIRTSESGN